jgi:hypothetical protein
MLNVARAKLKAGRAEAARDAAERAVAILLDVRPGALRDRRGAKTAGVHRKCARPMTTRMEGGEISS